MASVSEVPIRIEVHAAVGDREPSVIGGGTVKVPIETATTDDVVTVTVTETAVIAALRRGLTDGLAVEDG